VLASGHTSAYFFPWLKPPVRSLGLTVWNLLQCTRIENAHKLRKIIFDFYYVAVICTTSLGTEQIRACVSFYDQPPELPIRSLKWCTYCKHRCAAVLAHTQDCHIQKLKRETSDASKSQLNQASWNRIIVKFGSQKASIIIFQSSFCDFPLIARSAKVTSLSVSLGVHRTPSA